jgi:hypothetical protein
MMTNRGGAMKRGGLLLVLLSIGCVEHSKGLIEIIGQSTGSGYSVRAFFQRGAPKEQPPTTVCMGGNQCERITCTRTSAGPCTLSKCTSEFVPVPPPDLSFTPPDLAVTQMDMGVPEAPLLAPSAGTILVSGRATAQLVPSRNGYSQANGNETLFMAGDKVGVQATGDTVPGFKVELVGPSALRLDTAPTGTVFESEPRFAWTGGTQGTPVIGINTSCTGDLFVLAGGGMRGVESAAVCSFPGQTSGNIPNEVIRSFKSGTTVNYAMCTRERSTVTTGGYDVEVVVLTPATGNFNAFQIP